MNTLTDYNRRNALQPYTIAGIITQLGNTYCTKCAGHVNVWELADDVSVIFTDMDFCGTCHGCSASICNLCDGEY